MTKGFINELRQRNVFKVALGYLIASWLIAQVADLVLSSFDAPSWAMRALLIALAVGFPIALVISWAFEVTPEGMIPESQVDRTVKLGHESGRRLDFSILFILAIIVIFMGLERFVFSGRDGGMSVAEERELSQEKLATAEPSDSSADPAAEVATVDLPNQKNELPNQTIKENIYGEHNMLPAFRAWRATASKW